MVKPWTDMLAYDELRKGGPGDPFIVKELITERKIDGDHLECINELTDNFNHPPPPLGKVWIPTETEYFWIQAIVQ